MNKEASATTPTDKEETNSNLIENEQPSNQNSPTKLNLEATEGEVCWSPRFEFDAPRYTNFKAKKYRETRRWLNKLILGDSGESNDDDYDEKKCECEDSDKIKDNVKNNDNDEHTIFKDIDSGDELTLIRSPLSSSDSSDIDEWFNRFHPLHEPLCPMTPPGPLISPERRGNRLIIQNELKASPLKLESTGSFSSSFTQSPITFVNTPSKGPNTRIGLRSKPERVLKSSTNANIVSSSNNSLLNSSPSSLIRTTNFFQESSDVKALNVRTSVSASPIKNVTMSPLKNVPMSPMRFSAISPISNNRFSPSHYNIQSSPTIRSPIQATPIKSHTISPSLSTTTTTSSISLSVSSLTKNGLAARDLLSSPCKQPSSLQFVPPNSPLKSKSKFNYSPLKNSIGIPQLKPPEASKTILKKRQPDSTTTTTTESNASSSFVPKIRKHPKIDAELEDIKKMLYQHNSRIRPNKRNP